MQTNKTRIGNRYDLCEKIGTGGMGVVYRAYDLLTGRDVALKHVTVADQNLDFNARTSMGRDGDVRLALAQEFRTLASMRHPNIISVIDYGFDNDGVPYFTMEYLENAQTLLQAGRERSFADKIDLLVQILQALAYLHRHNLIHRDLKPGNVLVTAEKTKVLDFGLAVTRDYENPSQDKVVGTLAYIAPEVLQGASISAASDLYAVGVMAYELFAGKYPFDIDDMTALMQDIVSTPPPVDTLDVNDSLRRVLARLMAKHPADRYDDAFTVTADLLQAVGRDIPPETATIRDSFLQAAQFVGREGEMLKLRRALGDALDGRGSAWLIGGESGVGKSRLFDELGTMAMVEGALTLRANSISEGGLPYNLWRDAMRRLSLSTELTDAEVAVLKEIVTDIETLIGRTVPDAPALDGKAHQQRLVQTIGNVIRRQPEPTVLLMEDLQWTQESLEPLKYLSAFVQDLPLLIVANYRDDERADLPDLLTGWKHLRLKRLSRTAIAELSASMLGRIGKRQTIVDLLHRETEGNTFFIIEVVRALAEDAGTLERIGVTTLPTSVVAGGMTAVIRRRLSRIPPESYPLLKLAAVAGRRIDTAVLEYLSERGDIGLWLTHCEAAAVLEVHEGRWQFTHDKLREALLFDLNADETPDLHRRVASAVEHIHSGDDAYALSLAQHWINAGDARKAAQYAIIAGEQLLAISNYLEGRELMLKVLRMLPKGKFDRLRMNLLNLTAEFAGRLSDYHKALELYEESLVLARHFDDPSGIAEVLNGMAFVEYLADHFDAARDHSEEALRQAQIAKDEKNSARALNNLGVVAEMEEDFIIAQEFYRQSLMVFQHLNDRRGEASCLNNMGTVADSLGAYRTAQEYYRQSLAICREINYSFGVSVLSNNLGVVSERLEEYEVARQYYADGLHIARDIGDRRGCAHCLANMVFANLHLNQPQIARRNLRDTLLLLQVIETRYILPHALAGAAWLLLTLGDRQYAAEIMGYILNLPDLDSDFMSLRFQPLHALMSSHLDENTLSAAFEAGAVTRFDALMHTLLQRI